MSSKEFDESLRYFTQAEASIRENQFAGALFTLEEGLRSTYHSMEPIDSKTLLRCLFSFIGTLKLNLDQNLGDEWKAQVQTAIPTPEMCCSFCGQAKESVSNLIAGPAVNICNHCVDICVEIIADAQQKS
jgi:hypothetical protein